MYPSVGTPSPVGSIGPISSLRHGIPGRKGDHRVVTQFVLADAGPGGGKKGGKKGSNEAGKKGGKKGGNEGFLSSSKLENVIYKLIGKLHVSPGGLGAEAVRCTIGI